MTQKIERAAVEAVFGSSAELDRQIADFAKALKTHAKTKNKPAPTAHGVVEVIVRNHAGKYEIVEPPVEHFEDVAKNFVPTAEPPPPKRMTLEEFRTERLSELRDLRYNRQMDGVVYKNHPFNGDPLTLNAIMATLLAEEDAAGILVLWKDADGEFLELNRTDMVAIVKLIRDLTQACFNNENRLQKLVRAADNERSLGKINLTAGWPE
jgi:hypothetical protein